MKCKIPKKGSIIEFANKHYSYKLLENPKDLYLTKCLRLFDNSKTTIDNSLFFKRLKSGLIKIL